MNQEESTFDKMRHRPRFKMFTDLEPKELSMRLKQYLEEHPDLEGTINREIATIWVKTKENPLWKPNLSIRSEKDKETGKTAVRGVFGPNNNMWTLVMFLYFIFAILWMVTFTLWYVGQQLNINEYHWCLYISVLFLVCIVTLYLSVKLGQKKSEKEMNQLRDFIIKTTLKHESNDNNNS